MPGGRPTKCTKKITQAVVRAIRRGHYQEVAFELAGIPRSTAYDWLARGEAAIAAGDERPSEQVFIQFSDSVKKATAQSEDERLKRITEEAQWQSHAWYLERKFPERWALSRRIDEAAEKRAAKVIDNLLELVSDDAKREILGVLTREHITDPDSGAQA
jgi:hypothetical protein